MNADYGRRRPMLIVLVLFVISILLDRYLIAGLCPWVTSFGGLSLMVVFLDIPLALPMIDPLPVAVLFSLFYSMTPAGSPVIGRTGSCGPQGGAGLSDPLRHPGQFDPQDRPGQGERLSRLWGGVIVLACWMLAGALIYHFAQGFLPRQVRNGIDSFGIHADINTPFEEYSTVHLRGGFILLLCFIIGGRTLFKRINRVAIAHPVPGMISPEPERTVSQMERTTTQRTAGPREPMPAPMEAPVCTTISAKPPVPVRPRATVKSVAVVAPRRVVVEESTPLY